MTVRDMLRIITNNCNDFDTEIKLGKYVKNEEELIIEIELFSHVIQNCNGNNSILLIEKE